MHIAGEAAGYEAGAHFDRKEVRRLGRFSQFALVAAREAIGHAGLDLGEEDPHRVATVVGSGIGDFEMIQAALSDMAADIEAARLLTYRAAWLKQAGRPSTPFSASHWASLRTDSASQRSAPGLPPRLG